MASGRGAGRDNLAIQSFHRAACAPCSWSWPCQRRSWVWPWLAQRPTRVCWSDIVQWTSSVSTLTPSPQPSSSPPRTVGSVVLDYCVQGVKCDFIFANADVIMDAGVLKFVAPQYLARNIGCPHLNVVASFWGCPLHGKYNLKRLC